MKKDIRDYVKVYRGWYSEEFCNSLIEELETSNFQPHTFSNYEGDTNIKENDCYTFSGYTASAEYLFKDTWNIINKYVNETMAFPWNSSWNGYSTPKFNRYDVGMTMVEHCDHVHDMFDGSRRGIPILTIIALLNDNFEGGDLIFFTDTNYNLAKGDVIVFPSNFMYPHKVDTITQGRRYSAASWVW